MQPKFRLLPRRSQESAPSIFDFDMVEVGSGSFGKVYRSVHKLSQRIFAIKQISKLDKMQRRKELYELQQVNHELYIMYQFDSEYIVKMYDHFQDLEHIYFLMQYVEGTQLYKGIIQKGKRLSSHQIAKVVYQLCLALKHLHDKSIIHRDIKPQNIIVTTSSDIKLIDFGTSNFVGPDEIRMTRTGSLPYFAPEIVLKSEHGEAVDLWCVGILLYEMFVLKTPFQDPKKTEENILKNKIMYPSIMDPEMKDLIQKILVKNPEKRLKVDDIIKHPWITSNSLSMLGNLLKKPQTTLRAKSRSIEKRSLSRQMTPKSSNCKLSKSLSKKAKTLGQLDFLHEKILKLQKEINDVSIEQKLSEKKRKPILQKKLTHYQDKIQKMHSQTSKYLGVTQQNKKKLQELNAQIKVLGLLKRETQSIQLDVDQKKQEFIIHNDQKRKLTIIQANLEAKIKLLRNPRSNSQLSKDSKTGSIPKPALSSRSINFQNPLSKYMTSKSQKMPTECSLKAPNLTDLDGYINSFVSMPGTNFTTH